MTSLADAATTTPFVAETNDAPTSMPSQVQREIDRFAANLLSSISATDSKCLLMMEIGDAARSSLWLATSVASTLGKKLQANVRVLSSMAAPGSFTARRSAERGGYVLEHVGDSDFDQDARGSLDERLSSLRMANKLVILHLSKDHQLADRLLHWEAIDGVVLLVRASRTRRAALQSTVQQLTSAGVALLGCVLLDRMYPIPEKLYKLL